MPAALSIQEFLGGASFPLENSDVSTGAFPDAVRDTLLAMVAAAVNYEFGNATDTPWRTVREGTSLAARDPVEDTYPALPTEALLQERATDFPFLFLDRVGSGEFSGPGGGIEEEAVTCPWDLTWCLGPLRAGEAHRFRAALTTWFPNLVRMITENRCHPAYNSGAIPFGPGGIPLGALEAQSFDAAAIPVGENKTLYHGCTVRLQTIEYGGESDANAGTPFLGGNHTINVGGHEGLVPGLLEIDTTHPRKK